MWVKRLVIVIPPLVQPYLGQPGKPYTMSVVELLVNVQLLAVKVPRLRTLPPPSVALPPERVMLVALVRLRLPEAND